MKSVSVGTPWGSSMSEDFETLTCRHCGDSVDTEDALDVETPVGPISLCRHCHDLVVSLHHGREAVDHD
jgi:hypothetical protein